ncbi:uncharacterized protein G2W53_026867 [Senna tora]|uniref:Uncharacterized protein n=1 Tax=Senna tora TaxID=362788 RepID=A0A834TFU2_9FABA|nr:uncharacterized protein G2W53_026867 [Senna tora]
MNDDVCLRRIMNDDTSHWTQMKAAHMHKYIDSSTCKVLRDKIKGNLEQEKTGI